MASRLISILKIFGPRAARTADNPNSWATISLWRRFFQIKEEEEKEEQSMIEEIYQSIYPKEKLRPIESDNARQMRQEETKAAHRAATIPRAEIQHQAPAPQPTPVERQQNAMRQAREQQILQRPDLAVAINGNYTTLAQ
eukprot:CAMPEP_0202445848 /NCGR_PEP_ID=MMETSP1360-20130828/4581_1 /ASSEMBLY_ACC=CAM_ASM_000848 /TAXON_ID=515479 /ORGANISM="Licmophora paradoxa, Strain CCMP2313" /LENGTH=139 /DNA_ID=CAMNT_0049062243 /DNA_START=8 /DNA_END=427 /DNA_ORIENTATION=+